MSSYELPATATEPATHPVIPLRRRLSTRWISLLTLAALLALWWAVTATGLIEPLFLPPPSAVLQKGWLLATTGYMDSTLWQHLGASLSRIGLGLSFALGEGPKFAHKVRDEAAVDRAACGKGLGQAHPVFIDVNGRRVNVVARTSRRNQP